MQTPGQREQAAQLSLHDLGTPLAEATFVVVDLETTGGSSRDCGITEIGAVKMRGGEVLGEFATLVNPGMPIPPFIASLTGITDALVADAPGIDAALASFLEFAHGAVLVAHNAPFDIGFLRAACQRTGRTWPGAPVVDTARLARVALHRDEVRNCTLASLAAHFRAPVTPTHRALDDARATTHVLHCLIERVAGHAVTTVEDLRAFTGRVSQAQRTKRHLADHLPTGPGVYVFRDAQGSALYVGTSKHLRHRVRTYFTASEQRRRMAEMVSIATEVQAIECATPLEALVRELRLIIAEQPRYNRRSRKPEAFCWIKLPHHPAPGLSVVHAVKDDDGRYLGPYGTRGSAAAAIEALQLAYPLRPCTLKLARAPRAQQAQCALAELDRCLAPCWSGGRHADYGQVASRVREAFDGDLEPAIDALQARIGQLAEDQRYEDAARWRDRLGFLAAGSLRAHGMRALANEPELVAAQQDADGGWQIHLIRYGHLAGAARTARGTDPRPAVEALVATGEQVAPRLAPLPAGHVEEALDLLRWLEEPGVRLVRTTGGLSLPSRCGGSTAAALKVEQRTRGAAASGHGWIHDASSVRPVGPAQGTRIRIA